MMTRSFSYHDCECVFVCWASVRFQNLSEGIRHPPLCQVPNLGNLRRVSILTDRTPSQPPHFISLFYFLFRRG
jgi:hypothetical protein